MKIFALMLAGILTACTAMAAGTTANVSWTAPTVYTDGTALPATDIANYTINWSAASPYAASGSVTAASGLTIVVSSLTCGSYSFTVTVKTTATAYSPNAQSTTAPFVYNTGIVCTAPKPGTFTVTVN